MFKRYVIFGLLSILTVVVSYVKFFFGDLSYGLSSDTAVWGQFGDYIGGVLNPLLSFISVVLLIKSLNLQNQANCDLREELKRNERSEKIKSFGVLFFNMIDSQKSLLNNLKIKRSVSDLRGGSGIDSVIFIENGIEHLRSQGADDEMIVEYISDVDIYDGVYSILRAFYISVKMISEKLCDENGFDVFDRKDYFFTLINFTDFAQLRLIIIAIQFIDCPASRYLRGNTEFIDFLSDVDLKLDLY